MSRQSSSSGSHKLQLPYILNNSPDPTPAPPPISPPIAGPSSSNIIRRTDDKQRRHPCDHCRSRFLSRGDLQKHIKTVHLKIKDHVCAQCGAKFSEKGNLTKHQKRRHETVRAFNCSYPGCPKTFVLRDGLTRHEKSVHGKDQRGSAGAGPSSGRRYTTNIQPRPPY